MIVFMNPDGGPFILFFQQIWCEIDLICGDCLDPELMQGILPVEEAEQLVCRPVVQLFPCVRINVTHHEGHILLVQVVKGCFLRKYTADHFVGNFDTALLIGTLRIAIKHVRPTFSICIELNGERIRKFAPSVR